MQVGPSRELFEYWAPDSRNGLIITGYSIEGTLARVSNIPSFGSPYICMYTFPVSIVINGHLCFFSRPSSVDFALILDRFGVNIRMLTYLLV